MVSIQAMFQDERSSVTAKQKQAAISMFRKSKEEIFHSAPAFTQGLSTKIPETPISNPYFAIPALAGYPHQARYCDEGHRPHRQQRTGYPGPSEVLGRPEPSYHA